MRGHVPFVVAFAMLGVFGCSQRPDETAPAEPAGSAAVAGATPPAADGASGAAARDVASPHGASAQDTSAGAILKGTIAETMNGGGYTYVRLKQATDEVWVAAREFKATVGEELTVAVAMTMRDFKSPTLSRSFPLLYFASEVARRGETLTAPTAAPAPPPMTPLNSHGSGEAPATAPKVPPVTKVTPPSGGLSVADVLARRAELSGKPVIVRGTVVKFNAGILDRNWLHLQDGSGTAESQTHDLTITTPAAAPAVKVGDIVTAKGVLALGKDFGAGYAYDAILEDAALTR